MPHPSLLTGNAAVPGAKRGPQLVIHFRTTGETPNVAEYSGLQRQSNHSGTGWLTTTRMRKLVESLFCVVDVSFSFDTSKS